MTLAEQGYSVDFQEFAKEKLGEQELKIIAELTDEMLEKSRAIKMIMEKKDLTFEDVMAYCDHIDLVSGDLGIFCNLHERTFRGEI